MKDLVLEGFVKNFSETKGLSHLEDDELFEAFAASTILKKYHQTDIPDIEEGILVGGSEDGGLDAVAIMVNGRPTRAEEDVQFFEQNHRRLEVEFVFVQAKTSSSFNANEIGNFTFGVKQFFSIALGEEPKIQFNLEIQQLIELTRYIYRHGIRMRENPKCALYYVTTGKWTNAPDPSGRLSDGNQQLKEMEIFSSTSASPIDAQSLKSIYREMERGVVKDVEISKTAVFPRIDEVDDAYIGLLPGNEFIKLVSTDDGELNRELFYDNVRDFQGNNPVNDEITHTLMDNQLRHSFPLLNNGVTIVARELNRRGDIFTISDFQIVNGCQTTHIIFQNRDRIGSDTFVPVKLLATRDRQVISEVIKATNRQTAVLPEALESLTPFHKELEDFYAIKESNKEVSERIYYERRSKQYTGENISPKNIISLTRQIKSFVGMFLNEPHSHPRYYGELLRSYEGRLFVQDHKPEPYYASGVGMVTVERWLNSHPNGRTLRSYKYHLLMLLRVAISGLAIPKFNSNAISEYALNVANIFRDPKRCEAACQQAAGVLLVALDKFPLNKGTHHGNPPHRLRAFTERVLGNVDPNYKTGSVLSKTTDGIGSGSETGRIIWFDTLKNYGFIERDSGGDIFVHETEIGRIPWHLRIAGKKVKYSVKPSPKSKGMIMASEVVLETSR